MDIHMAGRYRISEQIRLHYTVANNSICRQIKCKMQTGITNIILTVNPITMIVVRQVSPFHRPQRPLRRAEVQLYSIFDLGTRRGWGVSVTPWPHLTPGKDPVPILQEAGWASGPVWTGAENLAPTGIFFKSQHFLVLPISLYRIIRLYLDITWHLEFDPRTVHPVGSRYTNYANRPMMTVVNQS
jgi:hypothetical protein